MKATPQDARQKDDGGIDARVVQAVAGGLAVLMVPKSLMGALEAKAAKDGTSPGEVLGAAVDKYVKES